MTSRALVLCNAAIEEMGDARALWKRMSTSGRIQTEESDESEWISRRWKRTKQKNRGRDEREREGNEDVFIRAEGGRKYMSLIRPQASRAHSRLKKKR